MTDENIIELFLERSEDAITQTSKKYSNFCYSISYNILQNKQDAEECVNDTFLRAWKTIPPTMPSNLSVFLGKITRNISLDRYKKKNANKRGGGLIEIALLELEECIPYAMSVEQAIDETILSKVIDSFLEKLPKQERMIFIRKYWHLNTIKEIANDYALSQSKVKSILLRTRNKLKIHLQIVVN